MLAGALWRSAIGKMLLAWGASVAEILLPGRPIGKKMLAGDSVTEMLLAGGATAKSHREDAAGRGAVEETHWEEDVSGGRRGRAATGKAPAEKAPADHKHKTREGNPLRLPPLIFALCETE